MDTGLTSISTESTDPREEIQRGLTDIMIAFQSFDQGVFAPWVPQALDMLELELDDLDLASIHRARVNYMLPHARSFFESATSLIKVATHLQRRLFLSATKADNPLGLSDDEKETALKMAEALYGYRNLSDLLKTGASELSDQMQMPIDDLQHRIIMSLRGDIGDAASSKDRVCNAFNVAYTDFMLSTIKNSQVDIACNALLAAVDHEEMAEGWADLSAFAHQNFTSCVMLLQLSEEMREKLQSVPASVFECDETILESLPTSNVPFKERADAATKRIDHLKIVFDAVRAGDPDTEAQLIAELFADKDISTEQAVTEAALSVNTGVLRKESALTGTLLNYALRLEDLMLEEQSEILSGVVSDSGRHDATSIKKFYTSFSEDASACHRFATKTGLSAISRIPPEDPENVICTLRLSTAVSVGIPKNGKTRSENMAIANDALAVGMMDYAEHRIDVARFSLGLAAALKRHNPQHAYLAKLPERFAAHAEDVTASQQLALKFHEGIPAKRKKLQIKSDLKRQMN